MTEGQSISLRCRYNRKSFNGTIQWTFNGMDLSTGIDMMFNITGKFNDTLSINHPLLENSGNYTCKVDTNVLTIFTLKIKPGLLVLLM